MNRRELAFAANEVKRLDKEIAETQSRAMSEAARKKELATLDKEQKEIIQRMQIHYKNSGQTYLRHIRDSIEQAERYKRRLEKDSMNKGWSKRRGNWRMHINETDGRVEMKRVSSSKSLGKTGDLVRKGLSQEAHDTHMFDLFQNIADHGEVPAFTNIEKGGKRIDEAPWASKDPEDFKKYGITPKQVPANDGFGPLKGMYIEPHIYAEMSQSFEETKALTKGLRKAFSTWKAGKTVWNPATVSRNFISNLALMNIVGGVNYLNPSTKTLKYWRDAAQGLRQFQKGQVPQGKYGKEIVYETTLLADTFQKAELEGDYIQESLTKIADLIDSKLSPSERISKLTHAAAKSGPDFYQWLETSMKAVVYINARENKGMSPSEAEALAHEALFNYNDIPPAIRTIRRYYSPFVTFTYKALPAIAKAHVRTPWRLAPYYGLVHAANLLSDKLLGDDEEEAERKRRLLPDYVGRDVLGPLMPSHIRMPFQTKDGKDKYWDISYMLPWGDATREGEGALGFVPDFLTPSNPVFTTMSQLMHNQDIFTGKKIILDTDNGGERALKILFKLWSEASPAVIAPNRFKKMVGAVYGDKSRFSGEKYSVADATIDWLFGIKFRNMDYMEQSMYRQKDLNQKGQEIRQTYQKKIEDLMFYQAGRHDSDAREKKRAALMIEMNEKMEELKEEYYYRFMKENDE
jgi:hypothetical protein